MTEDEIKSAKAVEDEESAQAQVLSAVARAEGQQACDRASEEAAGPRPADPPFRPKRGLTSYIIFNNETRDRLKAGTAKGFKGFTDTPLTEMAKEISRRWKDMSPESKVPYETEAARQKVVAEQDMQVRTIPSSLSLFALN